MQFLKLLPQPSVIEIHGVRTLARHPKLSTAVRWRLYTGRYERPEIELVGGHLQPDDRYLELGAGLGIVSIFATRRLAEGAVKSFEADPEMVEMIRANCELNGCQLDVRNQILVRKAGIAEVEFHVSRDFWASSTGSVQGGRSIRVPAVLLDEVLEEFEPTFLMVDIEGGEYELLLGHALPGVRKLCIELHDPAGDAAPRRRLIEHLEAVGFSRDAGERVEDVYYFSRKG